MLEEAMTSNEVGRLRDRVLEIFTKKLQELEGNNLLRVVLFGSVARGDSEPDSDIDVFILVKNGTRMELTKRIVETSVDIDLEEGKCKTHISPFINVLDEYEADKKSGIPIFRSIDEEGIVLYDVAK
jgi:predicted nucleotidyltransferase